MVFIAQTPEQARLLLDHSYFAVLGCVIRADVGAAEVAAQTRLTVKQAHHKLTRLHSAGLIVISGERRRGGRPIKLYRAAADEYRVPFHLTDAATLGEVVRGLHAPFLTEQHAAIARALTEHSNGEFELSLNENGKLRGTFGGLPEAADAGEVAFSWLSQASLTPEQAAELSRRLTELHGWFQEVSGGRGEGRRVYQLGLMLTPGREGEGT